MLIQLLAPQHRRTNVATTTKQADDRHYSIDESTEPPLPPVTGAFVPGAMERQPSKVDPSSGSSVSRHTPPIDSGQVADAKMKDLDRSPIRSNARLLVSADIPRATSSDSMGKLLNEFESLHEVELDTFDSTGTSYQPNSSSGIANARHYSGSTNGSSLGAFSSSRDEIDTTESIIDTTLSGASKGNSPSFQSPIFKLVPLRRANTVVKDNDDNDDIYPYVNFRSSSMSGDGFNNNRSSSSSSSGGGVARPSTVSSMLSGSSKRNGISIGAQSKDKNSMDVVDIDDSLSIGSSPGGIERSHFANSRFVSTSSSSSRKSYTLSSNNNNNNNNSGTTGGKLSLNTNIFQDPSSMRVESKDSAPLSYGGGSVKKQDSLLSPVLTSSKRDPIYGDQQALPPSTASGRSRNSTATSSSRFRLPT
jgi:hypothetical protein